jgi:hypothetical protein
VDRHDSKRRTLRAHRIPHNAPDYTRVDISKLELARFLAGFASAEGHFGSSQSGHPRFVIKLRSDDTAVLAFLAERFGVGRLMPVAASKHGCAETAWLVTRLDELRSLVPVFDGARPLGRAPRVPAVVGARRSQAEIAASVADGGDAGS